MLKYLFTFIPKKVFIAWGVLSVLFFLLAVDVRYHGLIWRMDRPISEMFHDLGTGKSIFFFVWTELGGDMIPKFTWAVFGLLFLLRRWHYVPLLWLTVTVGSQLNGKMQGFFARPRPRFEDMEILKNPGFPSGHTAGATLLFGFLILLAVKELKSRELKVFSIGIATACILFVGLSRVALLVHHTTDVVGSYLWCSAWLIGCYYLNIAAYRWSAENLRRWDLEAQHMATAARQDT